MIVEAAVGEACRLHQVIDAHCVESALANAAVDFTEKYLFAFEEELKKAKHPEGLV